MSGQEMIRGYNIGRQMLYLEGDKSFDGIKKFSETISNAGYDPADALRAIPLGTIVKDFNSNTMRDGDLVRKSLRAAGIKVQETLGITPSLAQLKVADLVVEGAEPYGFWKQVWRVEQMDTPKLDLPLSTSTDLFGNLEDIKGSDNTNPKVEGGKITALAFDCSNDNGYYRLAAQVNRNWLRDNNFRAIEIHLKQVGERWYNRVGKFLAGKHITAQTVTGALNTLYGASQTRGEALINVIENQIPGLQFTPDTILLHPQDAYTTKVSQWGGGGPVPLLSSVYLDKDHQNGTEPGLAQILNVNAIWRTPWMTQGTVLVWQKEKNYVVGLRQDLEFEDFGDTLMGLQGATTSIRLDSQMAFVNAGYKVTSF